MKEFLTILEKCSLFAGIDREDIGAMLGCLRARVQSYGRQQTIFAEGDDACYVGILLSGSAQVVKEDFYGNRSIMTQVEPGELFGESFACAGVAQMPVSVVAQEPSQVMIIDSRCITVSCCNACSFHSRMIFNLLKIVAQRNLQCNQKIEITSKRTTREKLMAYLMAQAKLRGSNSFTIPYDRQALADYLGVERSAMSAEISKLRKDGIITTQKSSFTLL